MQKKLIALAIASAMVAPAMAFADASVYGIADAALASTSATGKKSTIQVLSGGLSTSRLGVNASEDLGGMKAMANLEYKLDVAGAAGIGAARQQAVGLSGDFGSVRAGFLQDAGYYWSGKFDPTAGSLFDSVAAVNPSTYITTAGRISRAIDYTSPNMSGFSVAISHGFNQTEAAAPASGATTGNLTSVTLVNAIYEAGPLAAGFAYASDANDNAGFTKTTELALGGSYDLGAAKLYASYQTSKIDAAGTAGNSDKGIALTAVVPVNADSVIATFGSQKNDSTAASDDVKAFTLAYLHSMSKMTTLYGAVQKVTVDTTPSADTTNIGVGMRFKF